MLAPPYTLPPTPHALARDFYLQDTVLVARRLLNCVLVRKTDEGIVAGRISETEAYAHDDPSCHSFRGKTLRNATMFGPAGHAYVYFTYGMHYCFNVVTGPEGVADAVLIRALEPIEGWELMRRRRGLPEEEVARLMRAGPEARARERWAHALCGGPAKLCEAFGLGRDQDGVDLTVGQASGDALWIAEPPPELGAPPPDAIRSSPRVGIRQAADAPLRFTLAGDPYVSRK